MTREPICKWDGSECYSRGRKKEMPCSMCGLLIAPGSVSVPKFTDYITPTHLYNVAGQPVPKVKDYFCADCFRLSRPYESWCKCSRSRHWYAEHEREKEANARHAEARRPPGPPPGSPPSTALAIPSPSSAASVSASSGGDINIDRPENLVRSRALAAGDEGDERANCDAGERCAWYFDSECIAPAVAEQYAVTR